MAFANRHVLVALVISTAATLFLAGNLFSHHSSSTKSLHASSSCAPCAECLCDKNSNVFDSLAASSSGRGPERRLEGLTEEETDRDSEDRESEKQLEAEKH